MTIELKNITVRFGTQELFSVEHLLIPTGSRIGVVGDNGTGKTTLFSLILGTVLPETGEVFCNEEISVINQLIDSETTDSGGEQTKKRIREALAIQRGILLADEPTNHLDRKGIEFLERKLEEYKGTLLVISHNRSFLDKVVDKIIEIENGTLTLFEGNYTSYQEQKETQRSERQHAYDNYQREKKHIEKAMGIVREKSSKTKKTPKRMGNSEARLHKMGNQRAKQNLDDKVKALETRLNKMKSVDKPREKRPLIIPFSTTNQLHRNYLIDGENYDFQVGNKKLLSKANFQLLNGSKTALLGANGTGKTSLMKRILQKESSLTFAQGVRFGYFSQTFEQLEETKSIYENIKAHTIYDDQAIRSLLAHMQFRGETIHKKIAVLSGGERSKVAISKLLLSNSNVLLLDEPTNHLDISSIQVLEEALQAYQGTILFISHDQEFIEAVATEKWMITGKKIITEAEKNRSSIEIEEEVQEKLLLENRKTQLLSELSIVNGNEKEKLEAEFLSTIERLKELNQIESR